MAKVAKVLSSVFPPWAREARAMAAWVAWVTVRPSSLDALTMWAVEASVKVNECIRLRPGMSAVLVAARRIVGWALSQVFKD